MDAVGYSFTLEANCKECDEYFYGDVMGWRDDSRYGADITCNKCGYYNEYEFDESWADERGWALADAGRG